MPVCEHRKRVTTAVSGEILEARQLLAADPTATARPGPPAEVRPLDRTPPPPKAPSLFIEPTAGRRPILAAIDSARHEIRLGICVLDDPTIGDAMIAAARRGVHVEVIEDRNEYLQNPDEEQLAAQMVAGGVSLHLSNSIFQQSYEKELVIDRRRVLIMTMCIEPQTFADTRDYGLVLGGREYIREVTTFFDNDWDHSAAPGVTAPPYDPTPPIKVPNLIWSPVNATNALTTLIQKARHTIDATTELLDDPYLESELIAAVRRGVRVRLILPLTPRGNPLNENLAGIELLAGYGVRIRVTLGQYPPAGTMPYMHAKTMIVDGRLAYLGSIDLDTTETSEDRELGITFRTPQLIAPLRDQFRADWAASSTLAAALGSVSASG